MGLTDFGDLPGGVRGVHLAVAMRVWSRDPLALAETKGAQGVQARMAASTDDE